jgi:hypothetical protein
LTLEPYANGTGFTFQTSTPLRIGDNEIETIPDTRQVGVITFKQLAVGMILGDGTSWSGSGTPTFTTGEYFNCALADSSGNYAIELEINKDNNQQITATNSSGQLVGTIYSGDPVGVWR